MSELRKPHWERVNVRWDDDGYVAITEDNMATAAQAIDDLIERVNQQQAFIEALTHRFSSGNPSEPRPSDPADEAKS